MLLCLRKKHLLLCYYVLEKNMLLCLHPQVVAPYLEWHVDVIGEELSGAESLWHADVVAIDLAAEPCDGIEPHVALQGRGDPRADALIICDVYPLPASGHTAMQRRLQHDVGRLDDAQHLALCIGRVDADKLFVESDGQWRFTTQFGHERPLTRLDGLLDGVDGILRQQLQPIKSLVGTEAAIGIEPQLHLTTREALANATHQIELTVEVDSPHLQFHTTEALRELILHTAQHLLVAAHPHQSVDGDALLTASEGRVEQLWRAETQHGGLQAKEHGGIVAHGLIVYLARSLHLIAKATQHLGIVGTGIAAQVGQRCTLAQAPPLTVNHLYEP